MKKYDERDLEGLIEAHLIANGYKKSKGYDKEFCVDREIFFDFLQATQGDEIAELDKRVEGKWQERLLQKLSSEINERGLSAVLKSGLSIRGVKITLLYRKSDDSKNEALIERYKSNVLTVARQVHFSPKSNRWIW